MFHVPISMLGFILSAFTAFVQFANGWGGAATVHCPELMADGTTACYVANADGSIYQGAPTETTDGLMYIILDPEPASVGTKSDFVPSKDYSAAVAEPIRTYSAYSSEFGE